jgi:hypothetical protein
MLRSQRTALPLHAAFVNDAGHAVAQDDVA